jgi:peptidoglycan hydrolase CwlO-like protein
MDTGQLFWILMLGQIIVAITFFIILIKTTRAKAKLTQNKEESQIAKINALQEQLEKIKSSYAVAQNELQELKKSKSELNEELHKEKNLYTANKTECDQLSKENSELKLKLTSREQELEKILSQSQTKEGELKNKDEKLQALEKENQELIAKLKDLDAHAERLEKEKETQANIITGYKEIESADKINLDQLSKENSELKNKLTSKVQELENMLSASQAKDARLQALEKENQELAAQLKDLDAHTERLKKEKEAQANIITGYKEIDKEINPVPTDQVIATPEQLVVPSGQKKKKIGEILIEYKFITKDILNEALEYQKKFGGNITQYLIAYGYINETQLAQCLITQFGVPYLTLKFYDISEEVIKLVPLEIAKEYWLIPIEKKGNYITLVMADPIDTEAINKVQEITGCKVQRFVGILSEIKQALEHYYNVDIKEKGPRYKTP